MPSIIPGDIAELIVNQFDFEVSDGDKITDLALISKSFVEPLRRRAFRTVKITNIAQYRKFELLGPALLPFVKELRLNARAFVEEESLALLIDGLCNVQKLCLDFLYTPDRDSDGEEAQKGDGPLSWNDLSPSLQHSIATIFTRPTLEYLSLTGIRKIPLSSINDILQVSCVALDDSGFEPVQSQLPELPENWRGSCKVKSLSISNLSPITMHSFLSALISMSTLEKLHVLNLGRDHQNVEVAQEIITKQKSLTMLELSDQGVFLKYTPPNLHTLHIHVDFDVSDLHDALQTIARIPESTQIKEIKIIMRYRCFCSVEMSIEFDGDDDDDEDAVWPQIDRVLAERFKGAQKVWAIMPCRDQKLVPKHFATIERVLPRMREAGLLKFIVRDDL